MVQSSLVPKKVTRDELNSLVDRAADLIRTAVDYKFILVLLFMKRLNDQWKTECQQYRERLLKEAGLSDAEAEVEVDKFDYSYKIPKQYLWDEVTNDVKSLPEKLATAISETAKLNPQLQGVINRVDFLEFARNQENRELLRQLVELFEKYNLGGKEVSSDVLGDAYEHILMKFAPLKAKEGEIYTPREVIKLMVEILDPKAGESVYDPCCGSGGMLIESYLHVAEMYGQEETKRLFLYGQERSPEIYAVGEMNLLLHEIRNANLANGDTLDYPRFRDNEKIKQFEVVIANPPWNQKGYGEERLKKADFRERFEFGYPPKGNADWAWIQHMLASAREKGRVAIVLDQGVLSRGASENRIRKQIIEKDLIETIILLPEKLFYNTGAAGIILFLNKEKSASQKGKVFFVNAEKEYQKHPSVRRLNLLSKDNIQRIAMAVEESIDLKNFLRVVTLDEIRNNDYELTVPLYVSSSEGDPEIDLQLVHQEFEKVQERNRNRTTPEMLLKEILNQNHSQDFK